MPVIRVGVVCLVATLWLAGLPTQFITGQSRVPQLGKDNLSEVVAAMTLEEKARLLVGMGMEVNIPGLPGPPAEDKKVPQKVPGAAGRTHAIPRLGIPSITLSDGPAGVRIDPSRPNDPSRSYYATAFPVATQLASSWDPELARKVGNAFGNEAREYGIDVLLAPAMNIHRNPLGGRNFEYYSEDPLVAGRIAAAFVTGVQGAGVGTSIKHFAANSQEFNRMQSDSIMSERALREIYLKAFEIAVKQSQPWTVMSSYNLINGTYASESRALLTDVLRNEWGFKGLVMTDWWAGNNTAQQIAAGNDVLMPGTADQTKAIVEAVRAGALSSQHLDESVTRALQLILRTPSFSAYRYSERPDLRAHAQVAREAAADGMVLLKNLDNALPLAGPRKLALYGNSSYELIVGGTGSGNVNRAYSISLEQGLTDAGFSIDQNLGRNYQQYLADYKAKHPGPKNWWELPPPIPEMSLDASRAAGQANDADVAVITIGRNSGEGNDRKVENDFTLSDAERALIKTVADAFHARNKKVVAVLNVGGVIEVASWRDSVDAILLVWQPGQEGGHAIAEVLGGKVNPSGKLATTFPVRYEDVPSAKTFPGRELSGHERWSYVPFAGKPAEAVYEEGIYVGYRYYDTFHVSPAYPFGFGLSYTNFAYGELRLSSGRFGKNLTATITVRNKGNVAGREVVQLYLNAPSGKLAKPASELKDFAKTALLRPGQSQVIAFNLNAADLASFDPARSSWVAEAGTYTVNVGASSADIRQSKTFQVSSEILVEKVKGRLPPGSGINELKPAQ